MSGLDPIAFGIGAMSATAIHFYRPTTTRARSLAGFLVCIMLAGIVAPRAAKIALAHLGPAWDDPYLWAVLLSMGWPLALAAAPKFVDAFAARISGGATLGSTPSAYAEPDLAAGLAPAQPPPSYTRIPVPPLSAAPPPTPEK